MDVVHAAEMPWGESLVAHRKGGIAHKVLFEGEEGSPDNYLLVVAREASTYYSPRHRHAWDQVRLSLEGSIPIGKDLNVDGGDVGYFPEGVPYGPQEGGTDRIVLLLQFGGASGLGYLSPRQLREGHQALMAEGVFENGVFRRTSGEGKKNLDAYEAIWRQVTGRPIAYPKPRFKTPLVMRPEGFRWRQVADAPGVRRKVLGVFPDRGLELESIALDAGASFRLGPLDARRLIFVREGQGQCGAEAYAAQSAVRLEPGEAAGITASAPSELFVIAAGVIEV